jgi:hypothetical protein
MHVNVSLLSYVSDHLFLHDPRLFFEIDYEIIFSGLDDLSRSAFGSELRSKGRVIHEEILLNSIDGIKVTVNLFDDSFEAPVK